MRIVAIAGGNNSNISKDGTPKLYEHEEIDKTIISISCKRHPNVLFISHASDDGLEVEACKKLENTFGKMYKCKVKLFSRDMLTNYSLSKSLIEWADVLYVGGGNTKELMNLWREHGIDKLILDATDTNKVLCGISAGAICWFESGMSDYLQTEQSDPNLPFMPVECLGLIKLVFNPHANNPKRIEDMKNILKLNGKVGLSLSDNIAICIVNNNYKLIEGLNVNAENRVADIQFWEDDKFITRRLKAVGNIEDLININSELNTSEK